jgi:hypothetical protein
VWRTLQVWAARFEARVVGVAIGNPSIFDYLSLILLIVLDSEFNFNRLRTINFHNLTKAMVKIKINMFQIPLHSTGF